MEPPHALPFATGYHAPVLCTAVVEGLATAPEGTYVDATLGGGGHTAALLAALAPAGRVVGIDRDADALAVASERLADDAAAGRFEARRGTFADLAEIAGDLAPIDGLLLDLGVSSHQIDEAARGFSHRLDAPLDMRMDQRQQVSADDVVNEWSADDLMRLFFAAGEEPRARRIAAAIVRARPVETTGRLADVVRSAVPQLEEAKSVSRVFQALRIGVNGELDALEAALEASVDLLREGGRVAVLSYHSLEDRRVKRYLRYGNFAGQPRRDFYGRLVAPFREITRHAVTAGDAEVAANPRARSAKLRIAERAAPPVDPASP